MSHPATSPGAPSERARGAAGWMRCRYRWVHAVPAVAWACRRPSAARSGIPRRSSCRRGSTPGRTRTGSTSTFPPGTRACGSSYCRRGTWCGPGTQLFPLVCTSCCAASSAKEAGARPVRKTRLHRPRHQRTFLVDNGVHEDSSRVSEWRRLCRFCKGKARLRRMDSSRSYHHREKRACSWFRGHSCGRRGICEHQIRGQHRL